MGKNRMIFMIRVKNNSGYQVKATDNSTETIIYKVFTQTKYFI